MLDDQTNQTAQSTNFKENSKAEIIKKLCELLMENKKDEGINFVTENYPFQTLENSASRQYTKYEMMKTFLRDGFVDRYSGEKLLFPGIIRLLSLEIPDIFKYHLNWKMSETHMIYWDLFPTIDHIIPIAKGGTNEESNWITTNQLRNSAKSNHILTDLGWEILPPGNIEEWDGLCSFFLNWVSKESFEEKYKDTKDWKYISEWKTALIKALNNDSKIPNEKTKNSGTNKSQNNLRSQPMSKYETLVTNVQNLGTDSLYQYSPKGKIYCINYPYNPVTKGISTFIINSPEASPINVVCTLTKESQINVDVIHILNYPLTIDQIIESLPLEQKTKVINVRRQK